MNVPFGMTDEEREKERKRQERLRESIGSNRFACVFFAVLAMLGAAGMIFYSLTDYYELSVLHRLPDIGNVIGSIGSFVAGLCSIGLSVSMSLQHREDLAELHSRPKL